MELPSCHIELQYSDGFGRGLFHWAASVLIAGCLCMQAFSVHSKPPVRSVMLRSISIYRGDVQSCLWWVSCGPDFLTVTFRSCASSQEKILWYLNSNDLFYYLSVNFMLKTCLICKKMEKESNFVSEVTSDSTFFFSPVSQGCLVQVASHFPKIFSSGYRPNIRTVGEKYFFWRKTERISVERRKRLLKIIVIYTE